MGETAQSVMQHSLHKAESGALGFAILITNIECSSCHHIDEAGGVLFNMFISLLSGILQTLSS